MKGRPQRLGRDFNIGAERCYDRSESFESRLQFRFGSSFGKPQIGRESEHGVVDRRMTQREAKIGHGGLLHGSFWSGRSAHSFPKRLCDLLETLECNCCNNRIPVLEVGVENRLAIFDLSGQATECYSIPPFALRDRARRRDNAIFAFCSVPAFSLCDTQSSISHTIGF